jgi:hypothetical protein
MARRIPHYFSNRGFMPHGMCYPCQVAILERHVVSDTLIALARCSILLKLLPL